MVELVIVQCMGQIGIPQLTSESQVWASMGRGLQVPLTLEGEGRCLVCVGSICGNTRGRHLGRVRESISFLMALRSHR